MPVFGDHSARIPAECGSISRSRSGPIISSPGTPFATPRSYRSSSRPSSSSRVATITLPHRSYATPVSSQNSISDFEPVTQFCAFSDPGL